MSEAGRPCDEPGCGARAEIRLTHVVDNESKTLYLCQDCAQAKGVAPEPSASPVDVSDFLAGLDESDASDVAQVFGGPCESCGMTFEEFRRSGRLGCAHCYSAYRAGLHGLLHRIHGATEHVGKVHLATDREVDAIDRRVETLRSRLERAVEREDFERAAEIRDRIQAFETETAAEE